MIARAPSHSDDYTCTDPACALCAADPIAEHAARIRAAYTAQRHRDAERHSEARAGAAAVRRCVDERHEHRDGAERVRFWTRIRREDHHADYAGQPPVMPGPILEAGAVYDPAAVEFLAPTASAE